MNKDFSIVPIYFLNDEVKLYDQTIIKTNFLSKFIMINI